MGSRLALWVRPPALQVTVWFHIGAVAALIAWPAGWRWILGALVLNHLLLGAVGMWPRSTLLGANMVRLPPLAAAKGCVALTFDDGPDPFVTPRVLDLLDRHDARASFFCVGRRAALFPDIVREIIRRGHSVENHTETHPACFAWYAPQTLLREINAAQATLAGITGCAPRFFRAPIGLRSPLLDAVLARTALNYVSWTSRGFDMVSRSPSRVLNRLSRRLAPGAIILLHDRHAIGSSARDPIVLEVLPQLLQQLKDRGLRSVSLPVGVETDRCPNLQSCNAAPTTPCTQRALRQR